MSTVGNFSTSEAVATLLGSSGQVSVGFTALFDGTITSVSVHQICGVHNTSSVLVQGVSTPLSPSFVGTTLTASGLSTHIGAGGAGILTFGISGANTSSVEVFAAAGTAYDIWGTFTPDAGAPNAPTAPTPLDPVSMSSWTTVVHLGSQTKFIGQADLQRSTDGGATWTTVQSHVDPTGDGLRVSVDFTDTGVPTGPLAYRGVLWNGADSATGPSTTAVVPSAPAAPTLTPLTMTSWRADFPVAGNGVQYRLQRSSNGGSTWTTVFTGTGVVGPFTYTDTGVPSGALAYRVLADNSVGTATGATATAAGPDNPGFPGLTEVLN